MLGAPAEEAEHRHRVVTRLHRHHREIDRACIEPRRRAGLEPALRQLELLQARRERDRRRIARTPRGVVLHAHMHQAIEKGARGQHHGGGLEAHPDLGDDAGDAIAHHGEIIHPLLEQPQIGLVFQAPANRRLVQHAVSLGARGPYRRPFGGVEGAELDAGFVRGCRHRAAKGVDFLHQMALADAADGRIAAHRTEGLDVVRQQQRACAHARRRKRSFGPGVTAADHNDIETGGVEHEALRAAKG